MSTALSGAPSPPTWWAGSGAAGRLADEAVLIGGHYDHLGIRAPVNGDSIYNGAEDNASGTAAVLAAAEAFVRSGVEPQRSILFMAFGAEESGLLGSQAFADAAHRARSRTSRRGAQPGCDEPLWADPGHRRAGDGPVILGATFTAAAAGGGAPGAGGLGRADPRLVLPLRPFPVRPGRRPRPLARERRRLRRAADGWGEEQQEALHRDALSPAAGRAAALVHFDGAAQQIRVILRAALVVATTPAQPTWRPDSEFRAAGEARVK